MPTKKVSTTTSMKRQTLGKAVPDNGRAAMKRLSSQTPSPTSETPPFGDQTNGSTSTSSSRRNSTQTSRFPGPAFSRDFNLPTLMAHIQALTNQLEEMQSQVETWQGHAMSFRDQRDELRKTLLQLSEQRWIMQYNQARGRPLNEAPPLSEFTAAMRQGADGADRERSRSPASSSSSSPVSPPSSGGISSSFQSMAMDVETPSSSSSSSSDRRPSSSDGTERKRSNADSKDSSSRRHGRTISALPSLDALSGTAVTLSGKRVPVTRSETSGPHQRSVRWEPLTGFVPHPARGLEDPNVAPAPCTRADWTKAS